MRNSYLPFLCLLLIGVQTSAQKAFTGSYVTITGETISVSFTDYRQWNHNPSQVTVMTADGKELSLTPQNTRSFTIDGYDTYVSRRFSRLLNPIGETNNYTQLSAQDSLEEMYGFLLLLTEGNGIRLYKFSDRQRENYFVENDSLIELRYKIYMNDATSLVHEATYRQQLALLFSEQISANKKIGVQLSRLDYRETTLRKFIESATGKQAKKINKYPAEFMVTGGASYNTFEVTSNSYRNFVPVNTDYNASVAPVIGIGFIDYSQRNFARHFITAQLKYYSFKNSGTYVSNDKETEVMFRSSMINLAIGLGRNFIQTPHFSWHVTIAPNSTYLPNSEGSFDYGINKKKVSFFTFNIALQTGIRMKNGLGVWLHSDVLPTEVQRLAYFDHHHRSIQLGVEWRMKKKG